MSVRKIIDERNGTLLDLYKENIIYEIRLEKPKNNWLLCSNASIELTSIIKEMYPEEKIFIKYLKSK